MPDLSFSVAGAEVVTFAAAPLLSFKLHVRNADEDERIQSIALRCQIQLETTKRRYTAKEQARLFELFGEPERWGRTLRAMLWTHTGATVSSFQGETTVDLPVPCTFDFNVAATKYFAGLQDGVVPLNLLFSGTVFFDGDQGALQVEQISWEKEATFKLPINIWHDMMDHYYPNCAWLCLRRDVFDRLSRYKMERGLANWEQAFERLIPNDADEEELAIEGSLPS
jgi:hypothetical protein